MPNRHNATALLEFMRSWNRMDGHIFKLMHKIAFTAKFAILRIPVKTLTGLYQRVETDRITLICEILHFFNLHTKTKIQHFAKIKMVLGKGLEPSRLSAYAPQAYVSTNSTT